ncbi:MAG: InlB B-repeat-containing protein [Clostridia bacterium]|nr:InlB B-repeat-containing protein [Clostridia bacterium]
MKKFLILLIAFTAALCATACEPIEPPVEETPIETPENGGENSEGGEETPDQGEDGGEQTPREYTVYFNAKGGTVEIESKKAVYGEAFTLPTPDRGDEYEFLYWKNAQTGERVNGGEYAFESDLYLEAVWDTAWAGA